MKVIKGIASIIRKFKNPVLALGVFDGVHLGHKVIIENVVRRAKVLKGVSIVVTFDPHPSKSFYRKNASPLITSLAHRINLIKSLGADVCWVINFNKRFSQISAEEFVRRFLVRAAGAKHIIVGEGFRFGKKKSGTVSLLKKLSRQYNFSVCAVKPVRKARRIVSSSRIRALILSGKIKQVNKLLGRTFSIYGEVCCGCARGRTLGYPTANIKAEQEIIPAYGVYAVRVKLNNKIKPGILNVGCRPTFGVLRKFSPVVEVHIFNFHKKLYGQRLEVLFLKRIRAEKRFSSQKALLAQIKKDELKVKAILRT